MFSISPAIREDMRGFITQLRATASFTRERQRAVEHPPDGFGERFTNHINQWA